ncbi:hypothetical protein OG883_44825 [Streptomyces sp. NBC_01142]|uniref:hypothetical protein n=1 Tax=Streptomyces sp. NBC_01142 TaxID=2975865 RepID=UPI002255848A|nr:hypothetical protein [Streptomyces sp. NBC_01142]MCX4826770.1 hypothetical protein [Streptomyces sp. NBC_01142]
MDEEFVEGNRIRVLRCTDEFDPLPVGATGTVRSWNPFPGLRQLRVAWDAPHAHRQLMLTLTDDGDLVEKI